MTASTTANALTTLTGLSFPIRAGLRYAWRMFATYDAAATTTGSRWTMYCATGTPSYRSEYALTTTTRTTNEALTAVQQPAASNASSAATTNNTAIVEGIITAGATDDTVIFQFASEVAASAITAKANLTYVAIDMQGKPRVLGTPAGGNQPQQAFASCTELQAYA